jgi:flagellar hook-associated protein 3 FlgL
MSGINTVTGPSNYGMMNMLVAQSNTVKQKLVTLTNQASSGLIGNTYAGLGSGAATSLDLRPQIANLQTWQNNVDAATGRISTTQSALGSIESIAANFYAQLNNLEGVDSSEIDSIAANARDALQQVAGPARYPVWRRLRVCRTGQRQSAGAQFGQYPELRLLYADQ